MSARWVITTPAPKTAICPACKHKRNRLSVYPTPEGKRCYACLHPGKAPTVTCSTECARLPRHRGECRPTLRRREAA